jgi:hypothetical protein
MQEVEVKSRYLAIVDDDDWDTRPAEICKKCGYKLCVCSLQHVPVFRAQKSLLIADTGVSDLTVR